MAMVDQSRFDATSQLIEFAERGRLITHRTNPAANSKGLSPVPVVVVASAVTGLGVAVVASGILVGAIAIAVMGAGVVFASLAMLVPALGALRQNHETDHVVDIRPAAVLPPLKLQQGNWIELDDAWVRIDEAGRDHSGSVTALLSTGDIIELCHPVTVAGGPFRPLDEPRGPAAS